MEIVYGIFADGGMDHIPDYLDDDIVFADRDMAERFAEETGCEAKPLRVLTRMPKQITQHKAFARVREDGHVIRHVTISPELWDHEVLHGFETQGGITLEHLNQRAINVVGYDKDEVEAKREQLIEEALAEVMEEAAERDAHEELVQQRYRAMHVAPRPEPESTMRDFGMGEV